MKKILITCLLCISCFNFSGCGKNVSSWKIDGDNPRFVPVDNYNIHDGTASGIDFVTYVDLENGTMWLYTEKFQSGYATTMVKLTDENNNACIYDGNLDELRDKYNYKN